MSTDVQQRIREAFSHSPSILDGGLGTELLKRVHGKEAPLSLLSVTRPELVRELHAGYRHAGAQWLTTHTFCADAASLRLDGLAERSEEITRAAVACCREVAQEECLVLGSVGPGPGAAPPLETETRAFLECLTGAGVEGLLIETQLEERTLKVLVAQALLVRQAQKGELFIAVSLVVNAQGVLPACKERGEHELLAELEGSGIDLLALNCSTGSAPLRPALARLRGQWRGRIGVYPNAGVPLRTSDPRGRYQLTPAEFATEMQALQREFDLDLLGGCCGVSPAHIQALAATMGPT